MDTVKKFFPLARAFGDGNVTKFVIGILVYFAIAIALVLVNVVLSLIGSLLAAVTGGILGILVLPVFILLILFGIYLFANLIVLIVAFTMAKTSAAPAATVTEESTTTDL